MHCIVFVLFARGERRPRRAHRSGPEHRKFLVDKAQLPILDEQGFEGRLDLLAIGAAVIEELDKRDIALRVAANRRIGIVEDLMVARDQCRRRLVVRLTLQLVFGRLYHVEQHFGVFRQVITDDRFNSLALLGGELGRRRRARLQQHQHRAQA